MAYVLDRVGAARSAVGDSDAALAAYEEDVAVRLVGVQHGIVDGIQEKRSSRAEYGLVHGQDLLALDLGPEAADLPADLLQNRFLVLENTL